jgi:hypothetical protein
VGKVPFLLLSLLLWVERQQQLVVDQVSNPSSVKVNRMYSSLASMFTVLNKLSSVAEVTVRIKNQGDEAYRPQDYGKSIIITRKFTKEGSTTWKIKSKDGKVVSTKKEELARICDHMNIQVDNPMNILTQGES